MNTTAIKIAAPNDRNGNPRRGWLFQEHEGSFFIEEGYAGLGAIRTEYLHQIAANAPTVNVTATEFNRIRKTHTSKENN